MALIPASSAGNSLATLASVEPDQPHEPTTGAPTDSPAAPKVPAPREEVSIPALAPLVPSPPPAAVIERARGSSRWRMRAALIVAAVSLLCVGGGAYALFGVDKASQPDTSTPKNATERYLQALFTDGDGSEASTFACANPTGLTALTTFRDQESNAARNAGYLATFSWSVDVASSAADSADVFVTIRKGLSGTGLARPGDESQWDLSLVNATTWRVCSAARVK